MNNLWRHVPLPAVILLFILPGCTKTNPAASRAAESAPQAIARTEFTERLENYFEYEPLHAGKPSQVRIHLTDLSDGSPVEKAEVKLLVRPKGGTETLETTARVGKVTGIYVADLSIPRAGEYDIEFRIKNTKLDERMPLSNFKVE